MFTKIRKITNLFSCYETKMSSGFKVNSTSFRSMNGSVAVYRNQIPQPTQNDPKQNEILFVSNDGSAVSTPNFVYIPNIMGPTGPTNLLGVNGDFQVNGNAAFLSHIGVGEINNGRYVEIAADTVNNAYVDFHSRDTFSQDYDSRILSNGGGTGSGNGNMFFEAASANFSCPVRLGSWSSNPFRLDYGQITGITGTNATGTITFITDMFSQSPIVTLTFQSATDQPISGSNPGLYVTAATCASFTWQIHGTPPSGSSINWIAMGL